MFKKYLWFLLTLLLSLPSEARLKKPEPPPFDILHYKINLALNEKDLTFQAKTDINIKSQVDLLKTVVLHFKDGTKTFNLPLPLKKGEGVMITTSSEGKADEREQDGLFVVRPDPKGLPQFFTQFEMTGARKIFPCFDEPFEKATTEVILTANARYTLLSNGQKVSEKILPDGRRQAHFVNNDPISTYHITMIAAELAPLRNSYTSTTGKNIPLAIYTRPGQTQDVAYAMQSLKQALRFFENYFGIPYPWDSYGIVALPGFVWGGMENKGLANLNEARLLWNETHPMQKKVWISGLVAHELAHEWFGNMVTMYWWDDLWLNEAFATFAADRFEETLFGEDVAAVYNYQWLVQSYFPQDRGALSHPILPKRVDTLDELFDSVTYAKGVQVVKMLETFVGKENFRKGLQDYFAQAKFGNATTNQFLAAMEKASDQKLDRFAQTWLNQKGWPHLVLQSVPKGLKITQQETPFVFKLNVGGQTWLVDRKTQVFPLQKVPGTFLQNNERICNPPYAVDTPAEELVYSKKVPGTFCKVLPVNRGGKTLLDYTWADANWPMALEDEDPFTRFETAYQTIQKQQFSPELQKMLTARLKDNLAVALGVSWALLDNALDPDFSKQVAQSFWPVVKSVYFSLALTNPTQAELGSQLLTLLGQADLSELYPFLRSKVAASLMDDRLGALAGLLRSSASDRYAVFEQALRQEQNHPHAKLELLKVLAMTPRQEVLNKLNNYLADVNLVAKDDSTIPIVVWRTIYNENKGIVYSKTGIGEIARFVKANLDRPGVAGQALETLEEVAQAPKEVKREVAITLENLLKENPPAYIASIGKKILTAARK